MTSPTSRTLQRLKAAGIPAQRVEVWNAFGGNHEDLFGFADVLALDQGFLAIQVTDSSHVSHRMKKINAEPLALEWLRNGGRIVVHGWGLYGKRGQKKTWQCRVVSASVLSDGNALLWNEEESP